MIKTFFTFLSAVVLAPAAFAGGYTITSTNFFFDFNDTFFDQEGGTNQLLINGSDGNYTFDGVLQIQPVISVPAPSGNLANGVTFEPPFMYNAPLFIDLTDFTVTCNAGTGVSCGGFDIDFVVWLDFEPTSNPLPVLSTLEGTAPTDFLGSFDSAIDLHQGPGGPRVDDYFVTGNVTAPGGVINQQLFAGSLNSTGATNLVFTGNFQSAAGLMGGQSVNFPNSFTTVLGPTAVPEPSTFLLLLSGAAALGWIKRRRA